jgi:glycosyltransferase involved in cell wall biosynthesis
MAFSEKTSQESSLPRSELYRAGGRRLRGAVPVGSKDKPLVTVITAVFNAERSLASCLDSVLNQDYPNVEHIVIDGASSDGTLEILGRYSDRIAFWKSEPDRGIYHAWNKGLRESHGEWICFLGADDEFLPHAISSYMTLAEGNPGAEFLSSRIRITYPRGFDKTAGEPWTWPRFARFMCAVHVGSMHHRGLFERYGVFDTSYKSAADYEFLLRARSDLKTAFTPAVTVAMQAGGASTTLQALKEKAKAKIVTGGRNRVKASIELFLDDAQYIVRPLLYSMRAFSARNRRGTEE